MVRVRQALIWNLKKPTSRASAELQMPQSTVDRILWKSLHLELYKLQGVQMPVESDEQLRSLFAAHICSQILEHTNFLYHIVFMDEAKISHLWMYQLAKLCHLGH
jgi:hypothetical protein